MSIYAYSQWGFLSIYNGAPQSCRIGEEEGDRGGEARDERGERRYFILLKVLRHNRAALLLFVETSCKQQVVH